MTNYSCAKRAADPSNQCAACPQWCGDGVKCIKGDEPLIDTMLTFYKTSSQPMQNYLRGEGPSPESPRFKNTFCSQCGEDTGPGDHGYSNCNDHPQGATE